MLTRREMLQQARRAALLATTAPWWLVRRAHAARDKKLIVWSGATLAPQVDRLLKEQFDAYAKQAGIKEGELDYSVLGTGQILPKLVASLEAGNPPDVVRLGSAYIQLYRSQGLRNRALTHFRKVLEHRPDHEESLKAEAELAFSSPETPPPETGGLLKKLFGKK